LNQTREELLTQFEAVSFSPHSVLGVWMHEGMRYEDHHAKLTVDVEDTPDQRQFFKEWKTVLLQRFEQLEIYIVSYPVDIV